VKIDNEKMDWKSGLFFFWVIVVYVFWGAQFIPELEKILVYLKGLLI